MDLPGGMAKAHIRFYARADVSRRIEGYANRNSVGARDIEGEDSQRAAL
jgi:hypothetical protein